jgi:hypothetical protein
VVCRKDEEEVGKGAYYGGFGMCEKLMGHRV